MPARPARPGVWRHHRELGRDPSWYLDAAGYLVDVMERSDVADHAWLLSSGPPRTWRPTCGQAGRPVDTLTVKALLNVPLTNVRDVAYRFCRTPECPTVYYAADGQQTFEEKALRQRVHQKHPADAAVFVCYCFRHTPGSIRAELREAGRSTAVERITAGINGGQCACEIRNPQGTCCLGNVQAVVKRVQAQEAQGAQTAASHAQPATLGANG